MKFNLNINRITSLLIVLVILYTGCRKKNRPPYTPYTPSGPAMGAINKKYNFSTLTIDPDGDSISMRFDWGNGDTSVWTSDKDRWFASEQICTISHLWSVLDTFHIRAQAKDKKDNFSEWSMPHCLVITPNHPPDIPFIYGPSSGNIRTYYQFSVLAVDLDGDSIAIKIEWGDDDTSNWSAWILSGNSVLMFHEWLCPGTYQLKAQAKDCLGTTSDWSLPFSIVIEGSPGIAWICATWSAEWTPRESHASVVFLDKMWVIGGHDCPDEVWSSPDGVNWTCETNSAGFGERDDHRAVVFDDKIWIIAGSDRDPMNDVWYSRDGVNWIQVTDSAQWSPRWDHSSVVFDNKIWILGGRTHGRSFCDVWYSSDGINWICATESTECVTKPNHTSVVYQDKIWVMGGELGSPGIGTNEIWFSNDGVDWVQATNSAPWSKRCMHTSVVYDDKMWILGGSVDDGYGNFRAGNDVWYSRDGYSWICETSLSKFPKRFDHTSVVFNNKIWVFGGYKNQIELSNDVWYRTIIKK